LRCSFAEAGRKLFLVQKTIFSTDPFFNHNFLWGCGGMKLIIDQYAARRHQVGRFLMSANLLRRRLSKIDNGYPVTMAPGHLSDQHGDPPPPGDRQPAPHQGGARSVLRGDHFQATAPGPAGSGRQRVALNSTGFRLQTFQRAGMEGAMSRYKRIIGDTLRPHTGVKKGLRQA
jgi:hypothetical protein